MQIAEIVVIGPSELNISNAKNISHSGIENEQSFLQRFYVHLVKVYICAHKS